MGLNPLTRPIEYVTLQGRITLYANKGCAEQLRQIHGVDVTILRREEVRGVYVVTVRATAHGRQDESTGAVPLPTGASGEALANAMMKAETKAKRRVTLSICGLGFLIDESELDTVQHSPALPVGGEGSETAADVDRKSTRLNSSH